MDPRTVVLESWEDRAAPGIATLRKKKAESFFAMMRENPDICWEELVNEFRRNYYDAFDEIATVLLRTDDPRIIYNCVRHADPNNPKEVAFLQNLVQQCDAHKHQISLREMALMRSPELQPLLQEKKNLPKSVRMALGLEAPASSPQNK